MAYSITEEKQTCLDCGREFYGRKDKKFCSQSCKNHYHNNEARSSRRLRNRIITDLASNYNILDNLIRLKMTTISICDAEALGFKPSIITGFSKSKGHNEFRCFDIKYCQSDTRIFNIGRFELHSL